MGLDKNLMKLAMEELDKIAPIRLRRSDNVSTEWFFNKKKEVKEPIPRDNAFAETIKNKYKYVTEKDFDEQIKSITDLISSVKSSEETTLNLKISLNDNIDSLKQLKESLIFISDYGDRLEKYYKGLESVFREVKTVLSNFSTDKINQSLSQALKVVVKVNELKSTLLTFKDSSISDGARKGWKSISDKNKLFVLSTHGSFLDIPKHSYGSLVKTMNEELKKDNALTSTLTYCTNTSPIVSCYSHLDKESLKVKTFGSVSKKELLDVLELILQTLKQSKQMFVNILSVEDRQYEIVKLSYDIEEYADKFNDDVDLGIDYSISVIFEDLSFEYGTAINSDNDFFMNIDSYYETIAKLQNDLDIRLQ